MNPELIRWSGRHGLPRFDLIADEDFLPAVEEALTLARARWEAIATDPATPDFANSIEAMENTEVELDRILPVFWTLSGNVSTPEREEIGRRLAPMLASYHAAIVTDPRLLARVEAVWAARDALGPEEQRLTELARRSFLRGGAGLDAEGRQRMAEIGRRLAELTTQFSQNLLAEERASAIPVPESVLAELPGWLAGALRAAAQERGQEGAVVTVSRSLLVPFLEHAPDRAMREAAQRAWEARGTGALAGPEADNRPLVAEILTLRHERAQLLGHESFAAWKLETEMAGTPERAEALLREVWEPALARARADEAALTALAHADGINGAIEAWDWRYYAARRRADEHALNEAEVKPYFSLDAMIGAAFDVAKRLFGLEFTPFEAPLWDAGVRAWTVSRDGQPMAVFLGDYLARPGKRSGAWCSSLQKQHRMGAGQRAIVLNSCNFVPAEAGAPVLLGWDDARTLFHEFGHALHHFLSDVGYPSISGTSVARDFVELPSQLYEHWLTVPEVLDTHARHVETGEPLPAALRDRLIAAENADSGFATVEYLESALVDLALHDGAPPEDAMATQAQLLADLGAPAAIPARHGVPQFQHVFAGDGYAAAYYSYMWSEVMDADAFAAFEEAGGPFDAQTARRLEREILSRGGSAAPEDLWLAFRGQMPGAGPLLKGRGLASSG